MKRFKWENVLIICVTILTLCALFFFLKDLIIDIVNLYKAGNKSDIDKLLSDRGMIGWLSIIFIEAMQMIVIFIPAEFIQVTSGIAYNWYVAIGLCVAGVVLGATIIYILVHSFNFNAKMFSKQTAKIDNLSRKRKHAGIQTLMYVLFLMPIVPFGAVCYYGSSSKISYRRYILTVFTGVIPSIATSICLSEVIKLFMENDISLWWLVLIGFGFVALLFGIIFLVVRRIFFKENKNTPDSVYFSILLKIFTILKGRTKFTYDKDMIQNIDGPFLLLTNHGSFYDVFYASKLVEPVKMAFILNRYYFRKPGMRKILTRIGTIPKRLFSPDIETIKKTIRTIKTGYPILMCPEGRLSADGTNYFITKETGKLVKQLKVPVVIATINGAYLVKPKWRKHKIKGPVHTKVNRIILADELKSLSVEEINQIINENITYNEFEYAREHKIVYKDKKKAEGLENILYRCPHCNSEYHITTNKNTITCESCGFSLNINEHYSFDDNELNIKDIHDWYERMVKYEKENTIDKMVKLSCEVKVKCMNMSNHKLDTYGEGVCTLDKNTFTFEGVVGGEKEQIELQTVAMRGLAFSAGEEFEFYHNDNLYYFYPKENPELCAKWALIVDEVVKEGDLNE